MKLIKNRAKVRKLEFIGIRVTEETKRELSILCENNGLKLSEGLDQIISNYIKYSREIQNRLKGIK